MSDVFETFEGRGRCTCGHAEALHWHCTDRWDCASVDCECEHFEMPPAQKTGRDGVIRYRVMRPYGEWVYVTIPDNDVG